MNVLVWFLIIAGVGSAALLAISKFSEKDLPAKTEVKFDPEFVDDKSGVFFKSPFEDSASAVSPMPISLFNDDHNH